jgi:hypothetical protein
MLARASSNLAQALCFLTLSIVLSLSINRPVYFSLGPTEQVLPEDGDRIQTPKLCVLKNK